MSAEHTVTELRCEILDLESEIERLTAEKKEGFSREQQVRSDLLDLLEDSVKLKDRIKVLEDDLSVSGGLKCPNCNDVGWFTESYMDHRGDECPEQIQCEFCYTVKDSIFNRATAAAENEGE